MKRWLTWGTLLMLTAAMMCTGCKKKEDTFEKMGRQMDAATDKASDAARDTSKKMKKETKEVLNKLSETVEDATK